jgi:transcriptional regulator with XRE-family HTH domain
VILNPDKGKHVQYETAFRELGERYRELRAKRKMVQEDVLEFDFSVRHYQQLESGRPHSLQTFFRLCQMFKVPPEDLIQGLIDGRNGHRKKKK